MGRAPGEGKGYPLWYSGLENSTDYIVHGVAKSQTRLSDFHFTKSIAFDRQSAALQTWGADEERGRHLCQASRQRLLLAWVHLSGSDVLLWESPPPQRLKVPHTLDKFPLLPQEPEKPSPSQALEVYAGL